MVSFFCPRAVARQLAEMKTGRESVCAAHLTRVFTTSRRMANGDVRPYRLFTTEWMYSS
jgi:hypothetical protein